MDLVAFPRQRVVAPLRHLTLGFELQRPPIRLSRSATFGQARMAPFRPLEFSGTRRDGLLRRVHDADAASGSHVEVVFEIDCARRKETEYRRKRIAHLGKYQITTIGNKGRWNGNRRSLHESGAPLRVAPGNRGFALITDRNL